VAKRTAAAAGKESLLHVVPAAPPPAGWTGKVHALATGVAAASSLRPRPEWLLLTDADIHHPPGSLSALCARARSGSYDMVSVMARLQARRFWERLLIPPFVFFFNLLYPFRLVGEQRSKVAAAAGGCILVRAATLERAGGMAAIRDAVIDDVSLAKAIHRAGGRLWLGLDPEIESVRRYSTLRELWRMVARSAFAGLAYRYALVAIVVPLILLLCSSPPVLALRCLAELFENSAQAPEHQAAWRGLAFAIGAWGLQALALRPAVLHQRVPPAFSLTLPLSSFLYALMTVSSAWSHFRGRGAAWKGRTYTR
jgi:hopene-associated glycosyltransferase HpnB